MRDLFGREITYMRLSVTELCNLRCRYCMPPEGVCKKSHDMMLSEDEMINAVEAAASLGISKIRITGGEPLTKPNILSICRRAKSVEGINEVGITTNGILLPKLATELKKAGVSRVNISLDTLNADKYAYMTRGGDISQALSGLKTALSAGFKKVKVNCVLIGGFNDDEIGDLVSLTQKYPLDVRFIELMPMQKSEEFSKDAFIPSSRVLDALPELLPLENDGSVARLYKLPDALGNVGLISAVSELFCSQCNRIRLTADGKLKPCLHSEEEFSIKGMTTEQMAEQMKKTILAKPACHGVLSSESHSKAKRSMNRIGG